MCVCVCIGWDFGFWEAAIIKKIPIHTSKEGIKTKYHNVTHTEMKESLSTRNKNNSNHYYKNRELWESFSKGIHC